MADWPCGATLCGLGAPVRGRDVRGPRGWRTGSKRHRILRWRAGAQVAVAAHFVDLAALLHAWIDMAHRCQSRTLSVTIFVRM